MLKKTACLLICVCLLLCLSVPALALDGDAAFTDQGSIRNVGAVQMLVDLGLISGYTDGTFRPGNYITREEVAKLIAILCTENPQAPADVYFYDAQNSWALSYIGYCAGQGIIGGDGLGSFRPKDNVTAQELAKMLLVILGQSPESYSGAGWDERVNADAQTFGIYYGLKAQVSQPVTRDNACLLIYNAMRCPAIADPEEVGLSRYVLDDLMNPKSYLEVRYSLTRYTGVLTGNEFADLTGTDARLDAGTTKLAGHKAFAASSDLSMLGRNVDIYVKDGRVVGMPCVVSSELSYTFENAQALGKLLSGGAFSMAEDAQYYYNFNQTSAEVLSRANARMTVIDHDGDMQFDTVLAVGCQEAVVTAVSPLTVDLGQTVQSVEKYSLSDAFAVGDKVWYMDIGGRGFIQPAD